MKTFTRQGFLGTTHNGDKVYLEVRVEELTGERFTVDHRTVTNGARVSFQGHYFVKGSRRRDWSGGGQITSVLRDIATPAPGFTRNGIGRLVDLWDEWHLNDLQPGCVHQPRVPAAECKTVPLCPETGYRYGHDWLTKIVPDAVFDEIDRLTRDLDGTDGLK